MKKKQIVLMTTAAAVTGLAIYLAIRKYRSVQERIYEEKKEERANVFSHAKKYGGNEFVI
jgi:hypothetical protein